MPNTPKYASALQAKCRECDRVFNMLDEDDANEYWYGHDCEDNDNE